MDSEETITRMVENCFMFNRELSQADIMVLDSTHTEFKRVALVLELRE
jgi:hypothetical protein